MNDFILDYIKDKVKLALRIKSESFDSEICDLVNACVNDLELSGVSTEKLKCENYEDEKPLITRAIILYCKANFGSEDESGRFRRAYEALRDSLALAGDEL